MTTQSTIIIIKQLLSLLLEIFVWLKSDRSWFSYVLHEFEIHSTKSKILIN